jgi:hypothetical protein
MSGDSIGQGSWVRGKLLAEPVIDEQYISQDMEED